MFILFIVTVFSHVLVFVSFMMSLHSHMHIIDMVYSPTGITMAVTYMLY